ncbi:MAG: hypothetical protein ACYST6_07170 [Planctomycetota bacterium]|jgi:hypothetical protein
MKKKITTLLVAMLLVGAYQANADLLFESGYNVFDGSSGYHDEVGVINDAHLDVLGGQIGVTLAFHENATGNIYAGEISWLWTADNAVVDVFGGSFDYFAFHSPSVSPTVFLYAYDTIIHPDGGANNLPWIEGKYWLDDSAFAVTFDGQDSISRLSVVPEPSSIIVLAIGALLAKRAC